MELKAFAELAASIFEAAGISVMLGGAALAPLILLYRRWKGGLRIQDAYRWIRNHLGLSILLGLELLVAADIVRTVSQAPSLNGVLVLGLIVLIRTFLSITLEVELEGVWPWQRSRPRNRRGLTRGRDAGRGGSPRGW